MIEACLLILMFQISELETMKRQLAAILYADVTGYSRLTGFDEEQTHQKLNVGLNLLTDVITAHGGQKIHEAGDAILAEFQSVTMAVDSAVKFQRQMALQNNGLADNERLEFRVGINLGEVIHDRDDIYGDDVNVSARIEELAEPGGICISGTVFEQVNGKVEHVFDDLGHQKVKNITKPIRVYAVRLSDTAVSTGHGPFFGESAAKKTLTTGRCLCGKVRFEISASPLDINFCHCRMCQRWAGGPLSASATFPKEAVRFTRGEPKYYKSSPIAERGFCSNCGSSLIYRGLIPEWAGWLAIRVASLDNPQDFPPTWHVGVESQMPWADINDNLPRVRTEDSPAIVKAWESVGIEDAWKGWEEEN
jgi:adenylate cyclase